MFNDVLLYTTVPNSEGFCKGKHMLPLINMELKDIPDTATSQFTFEMIGSKKNILVQASSSADKYQWMTSVRTHTTTPATLSLSNIIHFDSYD